MSKAGLPNHLAFPASKGKLVEKLGDIPQIEDIVVDYRYHKPMTERRSQKIKGGSRKYRDSSGDIIVARYQLRAISLTTPNFMLKPESRLNTYTKPKWSVVLSPVSLKDLSLVREELEREAYQKLRDWFIDTNKYAGQIGDHSLTIEFDGSQLRYHQNDHIY